MNCHPEQREGPASSRPTPTLSSRPKAAPFAGVVERSAAPFHRIWIATLLLTTALQAQTLTSIRKAQTLTCGISQSESEYNMADAHGPRVAFDTELCHAVAVAILGPQARFAIKGYPDNDTALDALRHHEVDLIASISDDFSHSTLPGISLTQPVLLDAQGFLVLHSSHIRQPSDLSNKKICVLEDTEAEEALRFYFAQHHLAFSPYPFQEEGEMEAAFVTGNCAALSGDLTRLANTRAAIGVTAKNYDILSATVAPDPLAMAYRSDDPTFGNILQTTINILLAAQAAGVTQLNSATLAAAKDLDPIRRRLLGQTRELGHPLTLDDSWPLNVLTTTGNYAEIYDRTLGSNSPLHLILPAPQPFPLK